MSDLNTTTHDVMNDALPIRDSDQQDTVDTIHNQLAYLQQLYGLSSALLKASTPQELLEVIIAPLQDTGIRASIYKTVYDDNGQAEYAETIAQHNAYIPVGGRFSLRTAIGRALASAPSTPIIIDDVNQGHAVIDAPLAAVLATNKVTSLTFVPLSSTDGRWIATMQLSWHQPFRIPQTVLDLYEILIPQLAAVIDNRWLLVEAQQSLREAARLHETSARLSDAHDEQAVIEVMGDVLRAENINAVTLTLFNTGDYDTSTEYHVIGSWRADGRSIQGESGQIAEIPLGNHLTRSQLTVINDLTTDPRLDPATRETMQQQGIQSLAVVPVTLGMRWMGYLSISSAQPYYYPAATLNFLEIVGKQLTSLLDRFALMRQTERRAQELQTVAEVSASAAQNLKLDELLQNVVDLVKERFGLYHAHIYLLDAQQDILNLVAGAGEVGRVMVASKRSIPLHSPRSLVATAAREKHGQTVNDVTQSPSFLPHPLLPETRAEMAIPMRVGDTVIGVLDVQSSEVGRFTQDDMRVKATLADQIAVAIQNARAYQEVEKARKETQRIFETSTDLIGSANFNGQFLTLNPAWQRVLGYTQEELLATPFIELVHPDDMAETIAAAAKIYQGNDTATFANRYLAKDGQYRWIEWSTASDIEAQMVYFVARDVTEQKIATRQVAMNNALMRSIIDATPDWIFTKDRDFRYTMVNEGFAKSMQRRPEDVVGKTDIELGFPEDIVFGNFDKGIIGFRNDDLFVLNSGQEIHNPYDPAKTADGSIVVFDTRKIPLRDARGEVYGVLGFAHDITEVTRRANEMQTVSEVSTRAARNLNLDELLPNVSALVKERFNLYHAHIYLVDEAEGLLKLTAGAGDVGRQMVAEGRVIPLLAEKSLVATAARRKHGIIVNDVLVDENFLAHPLLPHTRAEMAVPLMVGDEVLGVLDVQSDTANRFTDNDIQVQTILAEQIAVAVQNARLFEEAQTRLRDITLSITLTEILRRDSDTDTLIESLLNAIGSSFDADSAVFTVVNKHTNQWNGVGGVGTVTMALAKTFIDPYEFYTHGVEALENQKVITISDTSKYPNFPQAYIDILGLKSVMTIPVFTGSEATGVVFLNFTTPRRFTDDEILLAGSLSNQISAALERRASEAALAASESRFRGIADSLPGTLYQFGVVDGTWQMNYVSPAIEILTGISAEQIMADFENLVRLFLPDEVPAFIESVSQAVSESENWFYEGQLVNAKTREVRWWQAIATPTRLADGRLVHNGVILDITERKNAELMLAKRAVELQTVSELATETASALNTDAVLQEIVDLVKERFDLYHAHIYLIDNETDSLKLAAGAGEIGRIMMERGHRIPSNAANSIVARAAREQEGLIVKDVQSFEYFLPNPMLPQTRAEMAVPLVASGKVIGVLDVQARQKGRFSLEDLNVYTILAGQVAVTIEKARAYAEIEKQAGREREAAERLREVDRLKSQFLANMSHELRTPLNSIIGYSEVLLDGVDGELPEEAMEDVQAIHESGKHLLTLINEILDLAKIEARQMKLDLMPINPDEFLSDIHKSAHILTKNKSVEILLEKEIDTDFIQADKVRLRQIMWNLVSNAVKFTEKGSVTIRYGQRGDMIYVKVIDTGIGIAADKIGLIFERFSQVDGSSTRRAGGTGLGLTITQQLVQLHGGEIEVESELGVGSIFTFTVPAYPRESKAS